MKQDDFVEIMREIVPQLIDQHVSNQEGSEPSSASGIKRPDPLPEHVDEPPTAKARTEEHLWVESGPCHEVLSAQECHQLLQTWDKTQCVEALITAYMQKKVAKEIPAVGNEPRLHELVEESKLVEWSTLMEKKAIKIHTGKRAAWLKVQYSDRFMGSRFVIVRKPLEENLHLDVNDTSTFRVKSRWCLQGHLDPDLDLKLDEGLLHVALSMSKMLHPKRSPCLSKHLLKTSDQHTLPREPTMNNPCRIPRFEC